ncbi:hypothetical protein OG233_07465 [Streptomyces sp. NBC_01218]|uniref:hypothetical protein n=1 Tax=Streptomyces sp. NBC_01218 TaxID=2903780 RepID=UPI002E0FAB03|nr:hypothetical protein OG233_07465 [Streptomyces sp. NBC_01218]
MTEAVRSYRYVGPPGPLTTVRPGSAGCRIASSTAFGRWVALRPAPELCEPFTYAVAGDGVLLLAPRRSEHVACAGGGAVLGAGEIGFARDAGGWMVDGVSNLSTGYCPDTSSWTAVARAVDRTGLARPDGFTHEVVFRRCPGCQEHSVVREDHFFCVFCDGALPPEWNVDPAG